LYDGLTQMSSIKGCNGCVAGLTMFGNVFIHGYCT
jgi:hypothetical protein